MQYLTSPKTAISSSYLTNKVNIAKEHKSHLIGFKMYFISGIQDKSNPDQVSHIDLDHRNNFTLVEYPELGAAMFKGIVYFPFVNYKDIFQLTPLLEI